MHTFRIHTVMQSRMQTITMIGSCSKLQWNMQSKNTTARSAADHQCAKTRINSLHPPPPKNKSNRRFNASAKEVQNTFDTKHKKRSTQYKDTMRPQQAIRSNTEHICTIMFIRRRILRVLPFVTRIWEPHTDSIPGCFIRPKTHIHTWKLEWSIQHVCKQRGRLTPRTGAQQHYNQFSSQTDEIVLAVRHVKQANMNKWKQEGQLKICSSGSSVITHIIKSQERFLHFASHLAFSHIMTEISFACDIRWFVYFCSNKWGCAYLLYIISNHITYCCN